MITIDLEFATKNKCTQLMSKPDKVSAIKFIGATVIGGKAFD
jgi:hypothetical protein